MKPEQISEWNARSIARLSAIEKAKVITAKIISECKEAAKLKETKIK